MLFELAGATFAPESEHTAWLAELDAYLAAV